MKYYLDGQRAICKGRDWNSFPVQKLRDFLARKREHSLLICTQYWESRLVFICCSEENSAELCAGTVVLSHVSLAPTLNRDSLLQIHLLFNVAIRPLLLSDSKWATAAKIITFLHCAICMYKSAKFFSNEIPIC